MNPAPTRAGKARPSSFCGNRSNQYGAPRPHRFTSHVKVTAQDGTILRDADKCCWCNTQPKPKKGKKR